MTTTEHDLILARQFLTGEISRAELRHQLMQQSDEAVIEALMGLLAETRRERDEMADDLRGAMNQMSGMKGRIIMLERALRETEARMAV